MKCLEDQMKHKMNKIKKRMKTEEKIEEKKNLRIVKLQKKRYTDENIH